MPISIARFVLAGDFRHRDRSAPGLATAYRALAIIGLRHAGREVSRGKDPRGQTVYRLAPVQTGDR